MASDFAKPVAGDHFIVEDLLDFSHHHDGAFDALAAANSNSDDTSSSSVDVTPLDSCNSSFSGNNDFNVPPAADFGFSGDLCVPQDDLAELEWLSNFVEESFSTGVSAFKTRPETNSETRFYQHADPGRSVNNNIQSSVLPVPGKARSKRSRTAPGNWSSRLVLLSSTAPPEPVKVDPTSGESRKCLHCGTEQTPQWRAGPMGPKTLCNACGVRYKSGRLVPEYRPASSPTFVQTKHSNSHRKVMELRRQNDFLRQQHTQQQQYNHHQQIHHSNNMVFNSSTNDDYLIHQQIGPDFRHII